MDPSRPAIRLENITLFAIDADAAATAYLLSRASGRGVASATFDSVEAMERNKDQLDRIRATGSQEAHAEVLDECDFELAVAHLRVPEMV